MKITPDAAARAAEMLSGLAGGIRIIGDSSGALVASSVLDLAARALRASAAMDGGPERVVEALRRLALDPPPEVDARASAAAELRSLGLAEGEGADR